MKKGTILAATVVGALSIGATAVCVLAQTGALTKLRAIDYEMTLDENVQVIAHDYDYYYSATVKNNEFNFVGFTPVNGKLGKISKNYWGSDWYNGLAFNRAAINGFTSLTVKYTGATLYYTLTDYLMEDMSFDKSNTVTSNVTINVTNNEAYFVLYTDDSTDGVVLESINVTYTCDNSIDDQMIFDKNSTEWFMRSRPSEYSMHDSYMVQKNNPLSNTSNYSTGSHAGNPDTWYRWNGRGFKNSGNLGTRFRIYTTILGNISQAVNAHGYAEDNYFNYSVWPEIYMTDANGDLVTDKVNWEFVYIGNDNYEPLGKDDPNKIHTDTSGSKYSYAGRFFAVYDYFGVDDDWQFADPDTTTIVDGSKTLRQAYNTFNLPYWFVCFEFEANPATGIVTSKTFINGMQITYDDEWMTGYQEGYNFHINTYHQHNVNYGTNSKSADKYEGVFTYPRIVNF